jgi:hypothetical protein
MADAAVSVIQSLISVAGALTGAWLGTHLSRGKAEREWYRDRCLQAYADILKCAQLFVVETSKLVDELSKDKPHTDKLTEIHAEMARACYSAELFVSDKMRRILYDHCQVHLRVLGEANQATKGSDLSKELGELVNKYGKFTFEFTQAARDEIAPYGDRSKGRWKFGRKRR